MKFKILEKLYIPKKNKSKDKKKKEVKCDYEKTMASDKIIKNAERARDRYLYKSKPFNANNTQDYSNK